MLGLSVRGESGNGVKVGIYLVCGENRLPNGDVTVDGGDSGRVVGGGNVLVLALTGLERSGLGRSEF